MSFQHQTIPASSVPLSAPYYGASIGVAAKRFFKKYATFTGRASRSEYWWMALISAGISIGLEKLTSSVNPTGVIVDRLGYLDLKFIITVVLFIIWGLFFFIPSLALTVRRLHDANISGWVILIGLVPLAGTLVVFICTLLPSKPEGRQFDLPFAEQTP
ncbi:DUF805 domain-containing protein [Arthrobacter bambusae]|uniref:Uncharacterized membrane protein YhaH (DUF805 family) n=1 Tax=Arthrobacter bambusae TaxID=1338426 RepID=A0AAW8D6D8_9MICC|nr:DUF805 domain-containing protein [Arthrobacter bambusae]MDP9903260.1 uncharacterized membrane protein YhaH (DUF805 family) [Arthrobacter bambusae]MDQ0128746.1 uncharacterized membrane protein YhaH (DUF805 family) [Arthrobacter bambusae]MDQ0180087.1 uncharacterized membrane protein YhaH (DUF805 family) [Arthrobacter bambusae]